MGIFQMGPPTDIVLFIKENFAIKRFIETGTYKGDTALWAANFFDSVFTVENSKEFFQQVCEKYSNSPKITFKYGDSRAFLGEIVDSLNEPALFWLDSHWCGGDSYGEKDQCPLLDELNELNKALVPQFILVDDARLFTAPPPLPNQLSYWPSISQIIDALEKGQHPYYITIYKDVILIVPQYGKDVFASFLQGLTTEDWYKTGAKNEEGNLDNRAMIRMMLKMILNRMSRKIFKK